MRVLAAMSGGVDSAVAAARAVDAGHDVTGVHLALSKNPQSFRSGARGCCSREDAHDARRAADRLGIPFYVWDLSDRFAAEVVDDFVAEYAAGRTPNPCLRCNEKIKFSAVLERGLALGFDAVCTGHYARLVRRPQPAGADGPAAVELHRAVDEAKDQSYVLGVLTAHQVAHSFFPLGTSTKTEVRAEAAARGLSVAAKPDSHDICFIPDGDTAGFLDARLGTRPGAVVDADGTQVGEHDGTHHFTIGQRRGLRLGVPAADGKPRFVLDVTPVTGTVTVGPREALAVTRLSAVRPSWAGETPEGRWRGLVQVRAHGAPVAATVELRPSPAGGEELVVEIDEPLSGVAPGQAVVCYDGTRVVGSATISSTSPGTSTAPRPVAVS
jgi:tRNA-specific 2-thiouridylase